MFINKQIQIDTLMLNMSHHCTNSQWGRTCILYKTVTFGKLYMKNMFIILIHFKKMLEKFFKFGASLGGIFAVWEI